MAQEIQIDVMRVDGLAAQLIEPMCEQIDGCLRVEAGLNSYGFMFGEEVEPIDAWQRVHSALVLVDPEGTRLTLADPTPGPATPAPLADPTHVEQLEEPAEQEADAGW